MTVNTDNDKISISRSAFLLTLRIRCWSGKKVDRGVTEEILDSKNAQRNSGSFTKHLLGNCQKLKALSIMATSSRKSIEGMVLPYHSAGTYFVPNKNYIDVIRKVKEESDTFWKRVEQFKTEYPALVEAAKQTTSDLFNEEEVPTVDQIDSKFAFEYFLQPIPDADYIDGLFQLPEQEEELRKSMEEANEKLFSRSSVIIKERLKEQLVQVRDKFKNYTGKKGASFQNKMVEKTASSIEDISKLNFMEDDRVKNWISRSKNILCHPSTSFKDNDQLRNQAVTDLSTIINEIS